MLKPESTTVMILAAGQGKRMMPLTANTPKPLLKVGAISLIEHHLVRLAKEGFKNIVINHAWLGQQIVDTLGDGQQWGLSISYSDESSSGALETAGGIVQALPLIQSDPFLVVNGDIYTDFNFAEFLGPLHTLARLLLVPNPLHNSDGDFPVTGSNDQIKNTKFTFSGIGLYQKALFAGLSARRRPLAPLLQAALVMSELETQLYLGCWYDIGTPERLSALNQQLKKTLR